MSRGLGVVFGDLKIIRQRPALAAIGQIVGDVTVQNNRIRELNARTPCGVFAGHLPCEGIQHQGQTVVGRSVSLIMPIPLAGPASKNRHSQHNMTTVRTGQWIFVLGLSVIGPQGGSIGSQRRQPVRGEDDRTCRACGDSEQIGNIPRPGNRGPHRGRKLGQCSLWHGRRGVGKRSRLGRRVRQNTQRNGRPGQNKNGNQRNNHPADFSGNPRTGVVVIMKGEHDPGGITPAALRKSPLVTYSAQQQIEDGDDSQTERTQGPRQQQGSTNRGFIKEHPPRSQLIDDDRGPPQADDYRRDDPPFPVPGGEKPDEGQNRTDNPHRRGIMQISAPPT